MKLLRAVTPLNSMRSSTATAMPKRFNRFAKTTVADRRRFVATSIALGTAGFGSLLATGCRDQDRIVGRDTADGKSAADGQRVPVTVQLNWYPEVEHGGVYQALADGLYSDAGLEVTIRPGGRATNVATELQMGRAEFAITNADDVVLGRRNGGNLIAVAAACQNSPRCLLVRRDSGIRSWDDSMAGMTLQRQPGRLYLDYLRQLGKLDGVNLVPYAGGVTGLTDPKIAIQAYLFSEPLVARQSGIDAVPLMVSELGWNPYSSVLAARDDLVTDRPDLVRKFTDATLAGWRSYLDDPSAGNAIILQENSEGMTPDALAFGVDQLRTLALVDGMAIEDFGTMSSSRWTTLVEQIESLTDASSRVTAAECHTLQFCPTLNDGPSKP